MTLFNYYLKQALTFMASFLFGALMYLTMIVYIFPTIEKMEGLNEMIEQMPKELNAIFNMSAGLEDINQFIAMEYYGMIFIILMLCFSLMLANNIYGKWIENKSFANMLNLPVSRTSLMIIIQGVIIISHVLMGALMALGGMGLINWIVEDADYNASNLFHLNMLGIVVFLILSLFTITCLLLTREPKMGMSIAAAVALLMYGLSIASKLSEDAEWLKYFTIFSLYDSAEVSSGDADLLMCYGLSGLFILIIFIINIILFRRKNLSL